MERIEIDRIVKRVHVGKCPSSGSVGRYCELLLKERGLDVKQERKIVYE